MTETKNRCTSLSLIAAADSPNPARGNWLGVFSDKPDQRRYRQLHEGAQYTICFIHEADELKEPGLFGVVFDAGLRGWKKDILVTVAATGIPIMVGPRARFARGLVWDIKPGIEAAGGIFEIATDEGDFKLRLNSVVRAALIRSQNNATLAQSLLGLDYPATAPAWNAATWGPSSPQGFAHFWQTLRAHLEKSRGETTLTSLPGVKAATHDLRHPKSGRLDGELIRSCFGLKRIELASLLKVTAEALRQTPDSPNHQETFAILEGIAALRTLLADPADFAKWLESPNTELENRQPITLIREGRASVVAELVQDILTNREG